jgi:ABC-2 type transport system ATP-binding protein
MATAIAVEGLKKSYKKNEVLRGVDFSVEAGTIFALLGSNGAGKTTTINILTTLIAADGGKASVNGSDVVMEAGSVRKSISLTGQFAAVDDVLTGRENLELIGDLRHVSNPAQTAKELLERFGLTEAADRRVATYSGGMRRRLDISMSLIGKPSIVFLDEPTTGLDPEARNEMWQTIRQLAAGGTTIFLTTQYLEEADVLADRIALLHKGTIVASGTASELKKLVPGGLVELTFHDGRQLQRAVTVLQKQYKVAHAEGGLTLTVTAGNNATELANLFIQLRDTHIEPSDFSQKPPTLDDVFFKLTSNKTEEK